MIKISLIFFLMTPIYIFSQDLYDFNTVRQDATRVSIPSVKAPTVRESSQKQTEQSARGFCSVEQAADKLLRLSNSNTLGFSDSGLLEHYASKVKEDCGPFKYIPAQIKNPGSPDLVCYRLGGECSNGYEGYSESNCAIETDRYKLAQIYSRILKERDQKAMEHVKKVREKAMAAAEEIVSKKVAKKLADNPFEQVRLSWGDMYEMRKELAKLLSERYGVYNVNVVINAVGEFMFSNFEYFSPLIALSGPAGFVVLTGLPIGEETFQCNISVRNILIKGGLSAATKLVMKVPIIKSDNVAGVFADKFIKSATTSEASKWVKHFFGDGLEVQNVSVVKQYGKEFALITVKSALGTGQYYSNQSNK